MSSLAEVLEWKFNKAPGIRTDGEQITAWPPALGPRPTTTDIDTWTTEFQAVVDDLKADQEISRKIDKVFADILFDQENRTRTLESRPILDRPTFNTALRNRIKNK